MHGGTEQPRTREIGRRGLSPHARGNHADHYGKGVAQGPIPACTGEPRFLSPAHRRHRAYPRMHGGTMTALSCHLSAMGLSPHARGNLHHSAQRVARHGPIPACTGEPNFGCRHVGPDGAYPRMHGGTGSRIFCGNGDAGLSPHARGNLNRPGSTLNAGGPIPACTGEPNASPTIVYSLGAYPRMHGGTAKSWCPSSAP